MYEKQNFNDKYHRYSNNFSINLTEYINSNKYDFR